MMGLGFASCSDVLDETPRATFTPEYFKTENGVKGGVTALYAHLRNTWGQGYYFNSLETGTDEYTYGQSADENFKCLDMTPEVSKTKSDNCRSDALWGSAFSDINTASGVIENGEAAGISPSLLAEARFFRGFNYFNLVRTFGGVPLDLGAGDLKFNTSPVRTSKRNTVPEVYAAIFTDLEKAVKELPTEPRTTGTVTQTTARLFLSKAYLTYAWWLENPNNIPTYPECSRNSGEAQSYFQKAYNTAVDALKNPGPYGLETAFADVFFGPNDRNKEILLYADHTAQDEYYNGGVGYGYGSGGAPDNFAHWMNRWNYTLFGSLLNRTAYQSYDRPWTRMATPAEVPAMFTDQNIDARFEGTFVTAFRVNWTTSGHSKDETAANANGLLVKDGDIALKFLGYNDPNVKYSNTNPCAAGVLPGDAAYIITPDHFNRRAYLNVWKDGYYNETTWGDGSAGMPNGANPRPYNIARFVELYFVAAEAAVKGATTESGYTAYDCMVTVRERAGKWRLAPFGNKDMDINVNGELYADHSAEMKAATPTTITVDYILDERFREFFGEGYRWWDLVRTQTWEKRAKTYTIGGNEFTDAQKQYTRTIPANYYLRPIPLGQIDALQMSAEEKTAFQNPGY